MSKGNPVIKKTIVTPTRVVQDQSPEQRMAEIESQMKPFKMMQMEDGKNRVLQGRNIVIPQ
jgi:hypothetical protein